MGDLIMRWEVIRYVTGGISLLALVVTSAAWIYHRKILQKEKLIESAPEAERGRLVTSTLEFFHVDTGKLTRDQQFAIALEQIRNRAYHLRHVVLLTALAFLIFGILTVVAILSGKSVPGNSETTYQIVDFETGEPVYQNVVVHYQRNHGSEELTSVSHQGEVSLKVLSDPVIINDVSQANGYRFKKSGQQPEFSDKKIRLERISGEGENDFRIQIRPNDPKLTNEAAYRDEIAQTTPEEGELEFYCENTTEYTVDVFFYSWHPTDSLKRGWLGPKACPKDKTTLITRTIGPNRERYFFIYGSTFGTKGIKLDSGNLYRSLRPVIKIWPIEDHPKQERIAGKLMY